MNESRPIWQSKTFWANALAAICFVAAKRFGVDVSVEEQAAALVIINTVMRLVTDGRVTILGAK